MPTQEEKQGFALRLKQAMKRSPKKVETAAELALNFNLRHPSEPITPQAAQKWLNGQALPTIDKIATLADWLGVSISWLGLGVAEDRLKPKSARSQAKIAAISAEPPTPDEIQFLRKMRALPEHRRHLLTEILEQFASDHEMK